VWTPFPVEEDVLCGKGGNGGCMGVILVNGNASPGLWGMILRNKDNLQLERRKNSSYFGLCWG